jgi:hypothetical protein
MREVDEAVRQDRLIGAIRRHGVPAAIALVVALAVLGGVLWWRSSVAAGRGHAGEQFAQALEQIEGGRYEAGDAALDPLARDPRTGIGADAALMRAAIQEEKGNGADATRRFAALAAEGQAPAVLRDLASLRAVAADFDHIAPDQAVRRLKPLAVPGSPWFANAAELLGTAYLKLGRRELAGPLFAAAARDPASPESLRGRARLRAGLLGVDAIDDVARAAPGAGAPAVQ